MNKAVQKELKKDERNARTNDLKAKVFSMVTIDAKQFKEIAEELGLSRMTVSKYYYEVKQSKHLAIKDIKEALSEQLAKLDLIEELFTQRIIADNSIASAEVVLKTLQQKARLLGLNESFRIDVRTDNRIEIVYPDNWRDTSKFQTIDGQAIEGQAIEGQAIYLPDGSRPGAEVIDDDTKDYAEGGAE